MSGYNRSDPFGTQQPPRRPVPSSQNFSRPQGAPRQYQEESNPLLRGDESLDPYGAYPPEHHKQDHGPGYGQEMREMRLQSIKSPGGEQFAYANLVAVSSADFRSNRPFLIQVNGKIVLTATAIAECKSGLIGFSKLQREFIGVGLGPRDSVAVRQISDGELSSFNVATSVDMSVDFAMKANTTDAMYPSDELQMRLLQAHEDQVFQVGQLLLVDYKTSPPIMFTVRALRANETEKGPQDPRRPPRTIPQAVITRNTQINIVSSNIPLMPTEREAMSAVAAGNTILKSNFRFEELGIGGLDNEFAIIFRRAFASRLFPPSLTQRMGIKHVRGLLLYGPPGTGKTLIARQIGKTLNAREPKIINGPEILNKYVGQSEENVRKVFADAEKEYKEKGDNSKLHVIIFDELDAVCKQRGTGSTGGAGVGDTIVNQLLTKLDGVDELNNLLLIGMTNRKDMIDEALLRPGRLEVHLEIGLPDERGRLQILSIHTANLRSNNFLDRDVDLAELAKVTQNYSGAEISGLVRSASSFAFYRHTGGTTSSPEIKDLEKVVVNRADFVKALEETPPMFGVSETDLKACYGNGIIEYSNTAKDIFKVGRMLLDSVKTKAEDRIKLRLMTALLHGPDGSGKTAIAAKLAITSGIPFIKFLSRSNMDGLAEMQKVQLILKIFSDADKSTQSLIVVDDIESLIDFVAVGPRFNAAVLTTLLSKLRTPPPEGRSRVIIATTNKYTVMSQLDVLSVFDRLINVDIVRGPTELFKLLGSIRSDDAPKAIVSRLLESYDARDVNIGVKHVLSATMVPDGAPDVVDYCVEGIIQHLKPLPREEGPGNVEE